MLALSLRAVAARGKEWEARRGPRVLVVDDNHDCADGMAILLRLWGYEARVAYTA